MKTSQQHTAIAYLRTDFARQDTIFGVHDQSLMGQFAGCGMAVEPGGTDIVGVCVDVGVSGDRQERQGLTQLFEYLRHNKTLGVVANDPSRFGEGETLRAIENRILKMGSTLIYADGSQPSTRTGRTTSDRKDLR